MSGALAWMPGCAQHRGLDATSSTSPHAPSRRTRLKAELRVWRTAASSLAVGHVFPDTSIGCTTYSRRGRNPQLIDMCKSFTRRAQWLRCGTRALTCRRGLWLVACGVGLRGVEYVSARYLPSPSCISMLYMMLSCLKRSVSYIKRIAPRMCAFN
jgi:hypothetical protein